MMRCGLALQPILEISSILCQRHASRVTKIGAWGVADITIDKDQYSAPTHWALQHELP